MLKIRLLVVLLLVGGSVFAQTRYTNYEITAGAGLTGNLHSSNFNELPGVKNCCSEFSSAFGIGWLANAGFEYLLSQKLFGNPMKYRAALSLANLSADYSVEEFIGYNISGNEYQKILVDQKLSPSLTLFSVDNSIIIEPVESLPLSFSIGISLGAFLQKSFEQSENLKSPSNITFENGKRIRNEQSGEIANTLFQIGVLAGARYRIWQNEDWILNAELGYRYNLTDAVKDINWNISSINAGLTVNYRITKPAPPKPKAPPVPVLPPPQKLDQPELAISVFHNGIEIRDGENISVPATAYAQDLQRFVVPVVFFNANTANPVIVHNADGNNRLNAQIFALDAAIEYMQSNPEVQLMIKGYHTDDESAGIAIERSMFVSQYLSKAGIDKTRISFEALTVGGKNFTYTELKEEWQKADLVFSDNAKTLPKKNIVTRTEEFKDLEFIVKPQISSKAGLNKFIGSATLGGFDFKFSSSSASSLIIPADALKTVFSDSNSQVIAFSAELEDIAGGKASVKKTFLMKKVITVEEKIITQESFDIPLGFFDFDKSSFSIINQSALKRIRDTLTAGGMIEIIPLTDNFGMEEYNTRLAESRALAAKNIIGMKFENIKAVDKADFSFPNNTPYGRMMNRSIWVRFVK